MIAIQPGVSALLTPAGVRKPGIGHQVWSVVSPPIRSSGGLPPARLRISWTNTGLIAAGSVPAYAGIAKYSSESPRNPAGIDRFVAGLPTARTLAVAAGLGVAIERQQQDDGHGHEK